ncbi:phage tail tape measure protein [Anaerohalosphaeraceae bacterium U12dextr]|jgi:hypothetical protein
MPNDINIPVNLPGAKEAETDLQKLTAAIKELTEQTKKSAQANAAMDASSESSKAKTDGLIASIAKWTMSLLGIQKIINEVTRAIQLQSQAMEENARIAESQQNSILRLQLMGDYYTQRPELRAEVQALAEFGRRPFEEVAGAYYNLRSNAGNLTNAQQSAIMREALQMGRTDPSFPLDTLINMFTLYAKQTGSTDMNRVQNVLAKTIEAAGGTGADVANYMPQFLPIGMSGGLSGAEAAGLWSYVTTQTASPAIATTGLRATFLGLQGKGTPESAKLLAKYGVTEGMSFQQKIQTLADAYQSGTLDLAAAERIAGREGASIMLSMLRNPAAMMSTMSAVTAADRSDIDLTGQSIQGLMDKDETARREENIRLLNIQLANQRANDPEALRLIELKLKSELAARQSGASEYGIWAQKKALDLLTNIPFGSVELAESIQRIGNKAGYPTEVVQNIINNNNNVNYYRAPAEPGPRIKPDDI